MLDMVYTGKLPLGKHNVSRIVAAADSLQMFDVAVGFKNVLTALVNQQPPGQVLSMQTPNVNLNNTSQSLNPERTSSADEVRSSSDRKDCKDENTEEPVCKRIHLELSESTGQIQHRHKSVVCKCQVTHDAMLFLYPLLLNMLFLYATHHILLPFIRRRFSREAAISNEFQLSS